MKTKALVMSALTMVALPAAAPDNVLVPDGASCALDRTCMNGSVVVGSGARPQATSVTINGI